jgi:hypothetical protein
MIFVVNGCQGGPRDAPVRCRPAETAALDIKWRPALPPSPRTGISPARRPMRRCPAARSSGGPDASGSENIPSGPFAFRLPISGYVRPPLPWPAAGDDGRPRERHHFAVRSVAPRRPYRYHSGMALAYPWPAILDDPHALQPAVPGRRVGLHLRRGLPAGGRPTLLTRGRSPSTSLARSLFLSWEVIHVRDGA